MPKDDDERTPTTAQWWGEIAVFIVTTIGVAVLVAVVFAVAFGRSPVVDLGGLLVGGAAGVWAARSYRRKRTGQ
ncbi:hypothetical protein DSC45_23600 [Streptomyces sp. YIM 130001]|uniref:hypothetical protein n=1 Tax=Streptomyces sp. YIM 130001 TaxID=2259644 RepID=UPI000E656A07|nr:hypothetical protein [Streptomyces sp. YIM 130001]RII13338.1 hypothetical protein DSC45_23600 [Streptomyces sp. YIM 130001]